MILRRSFLICFLLAVVTAALPRPVYSQVEINLDALEHYNPPPMFETAPEPPPATTKSPPVRETRPPTTKTEPKQAKHFVPPKPKRKPYSRIVNATPNRPVKPAPMKPEPHISVQAAPVEPVDMEPIDITEDPLQTGLITPSARDVLSQIDPDADMPTEIPEITEPAPSQITEAPVRTVRPTALPVDDSNMLRLEFLPGVTELPKNLQYILIEKALVKAARSSKSRIEIRSFASGIDESISSARRVSLARGLEIRNFLVKNNIDPKRIDIRPLGENTEIIPMDHVDILFAE